MKKNFKKWTALFLSVAMVAVSGVTTNTSFHAAEDTGVQESAADSDTETGTAADATSTTSATSATGENGTEATQEVALTQDGTDETAEADNAAATSAASSSSVSDSTETASSDSEATEEVTSSSSSDENKEQVKSEQEQIDDALKDATKRSYHYEDSNITVNAELEDPTAIPDEAEFKVTQITSNTAGYNYDAYMEALNEDAASDTNAKSVNADSKDSEDSDETESTDAYTSDNTLLYDMAFIYTVDVQNEDGNISKKEVEVQPAEGAVTINVEFKKNQLSNEIGAEVNDDVTVGHLPLKDSVKEDLSTTEEATNISANDIDVDKMTDATVSVENQTVTFDAENFSVYYFQNNNGVNRKYIWKGTRNFSFDEIANKIGDLSDYAIVANELDTGDHIEGNVRVGTWSGNISNGSKLNQDIRFTTNTTYDRITVTKTIENNDEQSVDFQFGTFEKENSTLKLIETFQITTKNGSGTIQLTSDKYPETFTELKNGKAIYIYEIDSNYNPIQENGNIGNYTVKHYSYSNNEDRIENGGGLDNYIGHFNPNNDVPDWDFGGFVQTKEQGKIVLGDEVNNDNGTAVIKGTNSSGRNFVIKIVKAYDSIIKDSNLSSKINSEIASMQDYSSELADAKYGPVSESGGLNVINLKTSKKESEQSGDFKADLGAANFINNNNGNFISDMDNQYLLINIDCGNAAKYSFNTQDLKIDNDGLNIGWTSRLANRIIVNFVRRSGNGYVPYDGEVDINGNTTCTIFAPGANVIQTGLFAGEIIANRVSHSGSEIHKYPINITTHKAINVNVVNEKKSNSVSIHGQKTINGEAVKTGLKDKFTFTLTQVDEKGVAVKGGKQLTAKTAADGTFSFDEITYQLKDAGKTYYYQIDEPTVPAGYTKHFEAPIVKVDVQDNGDGNLKVTSNMPDGGYTLDNTYKAEGSITVGGQKTVNGEAVKTGLEDKFTFTLTQVDEKGVAVKGGKQLTAKTAADGTFSFDEITYQLKDAGKTYYYQLDETSIPEGYTKNFTTKTVSVQVNDNGDGTLGVTSSMPDGGYTLDNTYKAAGSTEIRGKKTVNGEAVKTGLENKFTFTLTQVDEKGAVVEGGKKLTAQTAADGTFSFGELTYQLEDAGKTYYYQIDEPTVPAGYTKHFEAPIVKVDVQDNGDGKLKVTNNMPENGYTLDNTYTAGSVIISGTKFLTGSPMTAGQFYFDLYDADGKKIDTATNDEGGAFSFARLEFGQEDIGKTFEYTVREQHAGEVIDGIRYADDVIPVRVTVSAGDGGSIIAAASGSADFTNTQLASLTVNKTWNDNDNADGNRPDSVHVSILKDGEVVRQGDLSETTGWSMTFEGLEPGESYTVEESFDSEYYKAEQNDITVDLNGTDNEVTLVNDYIHPTVDIVANKVLVGGKLQSGQFTFQLYRNSDPNTVVATRVNDASGQIVFNDIEYDEAGYTVREVTGTDTHITYDTGAVTYDADGNVTGSHTEFTNTERPIVLRVQKRSKTAPYDPLEGATYGLYQVVEGGNDILVESEVSDENGYMYYSNIQPGVIYYFKEIAAPTGHEVDPYAGQKFQIKYTNDGQIALYDVDGNPTTLGDITSQNSNELLVQHTAAKSTIDTTSALSYSDDTIVAAAKAVNGAFDEGTTLKVTQLTGSAAKSAAAAVEDATGEIKNNVAYYDVQFIDKDGNEVEPKAGDVTVTIQYKDSLSLPEGTDASALKLVHITDGNAVEAVAGSIAAGNGKLLEAKITSDSFSTFGVVEPGKSNTLGSNYLVTAAGVSDQVSELNISKLDTAGKYVKGARLQIIEKATGKVVAEWNTSDGPMSFARWFDGAGTEPMNVDTYYILHEVSAPDGYQLADDIMFIINKYDSSITVYKYDDAGNLVVDQEAVDQWVSDTTLSMVDVPVEYRNKVRYVQKTIHNEKTIQGDNKVVEVTSVRAVKTGDTTPIALFVIMLAAAAVVLMVLAYRKKKQDNQ